uniref:Uncharacterized protein n=1 Tax=Angiostrongylus cantonensis TaxID=6313 RepID=A0A0K0CXC7_ANGCA
MILVDKRVISKKRGGGHKILERDESNIQSVPAIVRFFRGLKYLFWRTAEQVYGTRVECRFGLLRRRFCSKNCNSNYLIGDENGDLGSFKDLSQSRIFKPKETYPAKMDLKAKSFQDASTHTDMPPVCIYF